MQWWSVVNDASQLIVGSNLQEIFNALPANVFWKNCSGIYLGCNQAFAVSVGLSCPEQVVGKSDYELPVVSDSSDIFRLDDLTIISMKKPMLNFEEKQVLSDGQEVYLLTSKVPLFDDLGKVIGILGVYIDITSRKKLEKNLIAAKKEAEVASRSKSDFIANMSHDLRTPITGILGLADHLIYMSQDMAKLNDQKAGCPKQLTAQLRDMADVIARDGVCIKSASNQLLKLCNQVLEVVRLGLNQEENHLSVFDLVAVVEEIMQLLNAVAKHKSLDLSFTIDSGVPRYLKGNVIYFNRILLNLLANALKFTHDGFVSLSIHLYQPSHDGDHAIGDRVYLKCVIEDSGLGIPEDKFKYIFEHFSRLSPSYTNNYSGSGLGLFVVKQYVDSMYGKVSVSSELGEGSCFEVVVPFEVVSAQACENFIQYDIVSSLLDEYKTNRSFGLNQELKNTEPVVVLVVEDSQFAAMGLCLALERLSCTFDVATSGLEAFHMVKEKDYGLIFMDLGLPDISGIELVKKIKLLESKSSIPIVALTGHGCESSESQKALDVGMKEVYSKPLKNHDLMLLLRRYVSCSE